MADRYENIRKALAMGPTAGPYWQYEHAPQRVHTQSGAINISWTCNSDNGALEAKAEATAAHIAACHPDTIRALLAERDALVENLIGCMEALASHAPDCIEVECARSAIAAANGGGNG